MSIACEPPATPWHWFVAAFVTGPYALSRLTWAGVPLLAMCLINHYYCAMLMVRPDTAEQNELRSKAVGT